MDNLERFKMVDPDMDIRRLAKKLFPKIWLQHGVIATVPPSGPMSPARVTDVAEVMSEAVLVYSYSLRPVLQYYLEKHSAVMGGSKISFWSHVSFLCLRIRLARDHLFDYFLNATAVVAETALGCGGWRRLDDVHAWASTFFCAFFEHELIGPFYSAGGWAGLMNYIQDADLPSTYERLLPYHSESMWSQGTTTVLVVLASELLSAERRERITAAGSTVRGRDVERFEPARILAAKIFHWDFIEKFPMSPLAPGSFRRRPNIRIKSRHKSDKSEETSKRLYYINIDPCVANSAPNLRLTEKPEVERFYTQRSISIDFQPNVSVPRPNYHLSSKWKCSKIAEDRNVAVSSINNGETRCSTTNQQGSLPSSAYEHTSSPKTSFNNNKNESLPVLLPKSLFHSSNTVVTSEIQTSNATENEQPLEQMKNGNFEMHAIEEVRPKRLSLPSLELMGSNPPVFQTFFWKDDFTLGKFKQAKSQQRRDTNEMPQTQNPNGECHNLLLNKTFSFEDVCEVGSVDKILKGNSVNNQQLHCEISYEETVSTNVHGSSLMNNLTSENVRLYESMKTNHSNVDDLDELVAALLLTNVGCDPEYEQDEASPFASNKKQFDVKYSPMDYATTRKSTNNLFQEEDGESVLSSASSGICNDFREYQKSRPKSSYEFGSLPSLLKHSRSKLSNCTSPREQHGKFPPNDRRTNAEAKSSPEKWHDENESVVIQEDTQTVLYRKRLLESLAKRTRKARSSNKGPL